MYINGRSLYTVNLLLRTRWTQCVASAFGSLFSNTALLAKCSQRTERIVFFSKQNSDVVDCISDESVRAKNNPVSKIIKRR